MDTGTTTGLLTTAIAALAGAVGWLYRRQVSATNDTLNDQKAHAKTLADQASEHRTATDNLVSAHRAAIDNLVSEHREELETVRAQAAVERQKLVESLERVHQERLSDAKAIAERLLVSLQRQTEAVSSVTAALDGNKTMLLGLRELVDRLVMQGERSPEEPNDPPPAPVRPPSGARAVRGPGR